MIWRDSRGRFTRVPKTAIAAVQIAIFPTAKVGKNWAPDTTLHAGALAMRDAVGGVIHPIDDYRAAIVFRQPVSMDYVADAMEYRGAELRALQLAGARYHVIVRFVNGKHAPITKAYDKMDEVIAMSVYELRRGLEKYMPEDAEDDFDDYAEPELPPEPIRYSKRDARGRFTK